MSLVFILLAVLSSARAAVVKRSLQYGHHAPRNQPAAKRGQIAAKHAFLQAESSKSKLKQEYPYYHTSDELTAALEELRSNCHGADLKVTTMGDPENKANSSVNITLYSLKAKSSEPINKVFILTGEHARELIGPESTLRLLQALCGADGGGVEKRSKVSVADVLKHSEFQVVVNGNPRSRLQVEDGDYCVRANPEGVDLNRNWDEHRDADMTIVTNSGLKAFSEPETRICKKMIEDYKPETFISVHSGTLGMYMPWAWSPDQLTGRNTKSMMNVLRTVDANHCECPFGAAGKEVGYPCPGTSVDYVFDKIHASYSFAFEIWGPPEDNDAMKRRWKEKMASGGDSLLQMGAHLGHAHFSEVFSNRTRHRSDFVQTGGEAGNSLTNKDTCFYTFNPATEELFNDAVENWAAAYLEVTSMIAKELRSKDR